MRVPHGRSKKGLAYETQARACLIFMFNLQRNSNALVRGFALVVSVVRS